MSTAIFLHRARPTAHASGWVLEEEAKKEKKLRLKPRSGISPISSGRLPIAQPASEALPGPLARWHPVNAAAGGSCAAGRSSLSKQCSGRKSAAQLSCIGMQGAAKGGPVRPERDREPRTGRMILLPSHSPLRGEQGGFAMSSGPTIRGWTRFRSFHQPRLGRRKGNGSKTTSAWSTRRFTAGRGVLPRGFFSGGASDAPRRNARARFVLPADS